MLEKVTLVISSLFVLANEMFELGYEKAAITASVTLLATIVATLVRRLRSSDADARLREKHLDLKIKNAEIRLGQLQHPTRQG